MIAFLNGKIVKKQPTSILMDVNGVGYEVVIPLSTYDRLPAINTACRILTHDYVREDQRVLFGFMTAGELKTFRLLIGASGIGPKIALSALSGLSVREIRQAVVEGDTRKLSSISGIGKKMAERIIVELRHKISDADALEAVAGTDAENKTDGTVRDAMLALIGLGYPHEQARKMCMATVKGMDGKKLSVEEILRKALSSMAK